MHHELKDNAIFVADSHYSSKNQEFLIFLEKLETLEIQTTQLILLGDNFDFLSQEIEYFLKINKNVIDLLNKISTKIEIIYLEGNHDYNLQKVFPNIKVIKREKQPFLMVNNNKSVSISHGDIFCGFTYELYCKIIRNHFVLKFLNFIDIKNFISKIIEKRLIEKNICHKIDNFEKIAKKRLKSYNSDIVIEGHYHQGKTYNFGKIYINVPSLCCSKDYINFLDGKITKSTLKK